MTDQVENLSVGYDDHVSAGAKAAADALKRLGDEAVATETRVTRVAKSGEQLARAYGDAERLAAKVAAATKTYRQALADLDRSELELAEKERIRVNLTAQIEQATQKATQAHQRWLAGIRAMDGAVGTTNAGLAAATAAAGTWVGSLSQVYAAAGQVTTGLTGAARALQALDASLRTGHTSFAEWAAGAKGLESALRGVSAAQKAINDTTGVSRQTVNTATIGQLRYATTGKGAPTGNQLGLVTGDTAAAEQRLDDLAAAFADADAAIDRYRADLGLVDVAQRKFEAGLTDLQAAIRRAGLEDADATALLNAYTAAHDPAIRRAKERGDQERETARAVADAWDAATREREADAAMILADERAMREAAARTAAENAKLAASYDSVMASVDPAVAAQQRFDKALSDLRAGATAAGKSAADLAADEAKLADALSPAALDAKKQAAELRTLEDTLDRAGAARRRFADQQAQLDAAKSRGDLTPERYDQLTAAVQDQERAYFGAAGAARAHSRAIQVLVPQLSDVAVQMQSGTGLFTIAIQQGPQIAEGLAFAGREALAAAGRFALIAAPILAAGAALAIVVARAVEIGSQTRELTATMRAYGTEAQATAGQLRDVAKALYEGGADRQESFATAKVLASARGISASLGRELATLGSDMAAGLSGQSLDQTVKQLTEVATQGYPAIMKLQEAIGFLTPEEVRSIRTMAEHGRQSEALGVALGALHHRFDGLRKDAMSPAGAAMHELGVQFNRLVDAAANSSITISVTVALSDAFKGLADFLANPSIEGLAKIARATAISPLNGAATGIGTAIGKRLFGPADVTDLQKRLDEARAKVAEFEARGWLGGPHGGISVEFQRPLENARAEVASLEQRIDAVTRKATTASQSAGATSPAPAHRAANDVSGTDAAWIERNRKAKEYLDEQAHAYDRLAEAQQGNTVQRQLAAAALKAEDDIREHQLEGENAVRLAAIRRREALLQLIVAVNDTNRAALAEIAGNDSLAAAYGVSAAAVREAQIEQKAMADVARGTIEPYDAIVARLRDMDDAQRRVNAAGADFDLRNQIDAAARLAQAEAKSGAAVAEANVQNKIRTQVIKEGVAADSERARAIEAGTRALEAQNAVAKVNASIRQQNQDLTVARAEYDLLGLSNAEREKQVAIMRATLEVQNSGDWQQVPQEARDAWIAQAGAVAEYKARVADATETSRDFANVITKGFEDAVLNGQKLGDILKALGKDIERVFLRSFVTKPMENWLQGTMTKWLSPSPANDNMVQPVNDNDPGGFRTAFERLSTKTATLGASADNAMWVRVAAGLSADAGIPAVAAGQQPAVAGNLALAPNASTPVPVAIADGGRVEAALREEARAQGVPEEVVLSIARIESGMRQFRADGRVLTSSAGAQGVMQLMPSTAQWLGVDGTDTRQNVQGGVRFLSMLGRQFNGDWSAAAGAYNAGPTRMQQALTDGRALPRETVDYIAKFSTAMKQAETGVTGLGSAARGVTQAQEEALQRQLDALDVDQQATAATQDLSPALLAATAAAYKAIGATDAGTKSIEVHSQAISHIGENAISAADGLTAAGDGATALGKAATEGADTLLGGLEKLLSGASDWLGGLFGLGGSSSSEKTIKNADGSTSFAPRVQGAGGSWLDAKVFGSEQSRPSESFVGPMPAETGIGGWNPSWGQLLQGVGGIASGIAMASQKGASTGQKIGGGLMGVGGAIMMIPGGFTQIAGGVMMAAGALLSAVSGAKDRGEKYSISHITLGPNGKYALGRYDQDNGGDPTRFNSDASKVAKGLNDIAARLNLTPTKGDSYIDSKNMSAEQAALELLKGMQSAVPNVAYALAHETAVSLEDMLSHLEFANTFDDQVTALRSSISDMFTQFQTGVTTANTLGRTLLDFVDNAGTVFKVTTTGGFLPSTRGYATGTTSAASGWAMVGEEGPELVRLAGGERIWNARETARMVAGLGQGADTELVHVRPDELAWMERTLGGGRTNPATGLRMFLEGESGGVGDTGSDPNGGGGYGPGGATGASGKGGENAAHGETGNQSSGYGPAGPDHGFGGYDGPLSQAANHDAAVRGAMDGGLVGTITGLIDQFTGWVGKQTGVPAGQVGALVGTVGVAGTVAVGGLLGFAQGLGAVARELGIDGPDEPAGTGGETDGTGSEPSFVSQLPSAVATQLLDVLRANTGASEALISGSLVGPLGGEVSISQVADGGVLQGMEPGAVAQIIGQVSGALVSLRDAAVPIPPVLQKAAEQLDAVAAANGLPGATDKVRQDAVDKQQALYDRFAAVGLVRGRVDELNTIVASLADNTFSPIGKDFDALAADMRKAAGVYTAAGEKVPESLFGATRQMEALGASKKRLLDQVAGVTEETSPEQQKVQQLKGEWSVTATDLVKAFAQVGIVGDELAAKLNEGFGNALKKEQGTYSDSLDTALRKSKGEEGYDSAVTLIDAYKTNLKDVNALWPEGADRIRQTAKVADTMTNNLTGLVKSGSITSKSLDEIIKNFSDTPDVVNAATAALKQLNETAKESERVFQAGVTARAYALVGNDRQSQLMQLDETQKKELQDAKDKGYDTTTLVQVQAGERASKDFELAQKDVLDWYDREIQAKQEMVTSIQDGAVKVYNAAKQFQAARDSLAISEDAPISPQERLAEAKRQWDTALATVKSSTATDDEKDTARSALISLGQTLVSIEKTNSAGTARTLYDEVMQVEGELGDTKALGVDTAQQQLKAANDSLKELQKGRQDANSYGQKNLGKLDDLNSTMENKFSAMVVALQPLQTLTGSNAYGTLTSAQFGGLVNAATTKAGLDPLVQYAQSRNDSGLLTQAYKRAADLGVYYGNYSYAGPDYGGALYQKWDDKATGDALAYLKTLGYQGAYDVNANIFLQANSKGSDFTNWMAGYVAQRGWTGQQPETQQEPIVDYLTPRQRLEGFTDADIERDFGSMPDIAAVRAADPSFDLRAWFQRFGISEVLAGQRHIPGFQDGGVIGNGLWGQDSVLARYAGGGHIMLAGGEYVMPADVTAAYRPMLDAMRAGDFAPANDRALPLNLTPIRPAAAPQQSNADSKATLDELRAIKDILARLEPAIHDAEGAAQDQRSTIGSDTVRLLRQQLDELREQAKRRAA